MEDVEPLLATALALSPEEAQTYSTILEATSTLPKSDSRYALVIGVTWWLLHRRRRMEQQLIRRRHFSRRLRRLMYIRWQLLKNSLHGISSAVRATEEAFLEDLGGVPEKRLWIKQGRSDDFWSQVDKGELSPELYYKHFHMSKETFDFIYNELGDHLRKSNTSMREPLPAKKRLAATLHRLATNSEYLKVATLFGIGKSTTTSLVRDVCDVIVSILKPKFLDLDINEDTISDASSTFDIPQVIGALGSIDVFIVGSSWDWNESSPFSSIYSQSYALVFQGMVDHFGHFRSVSAGSPAGMKNFDILKRSNVDKIVKEKCSSHQRKVNGTEIPLLVVGDESYESEIEENNFPWLLTPIQLKENDTKDIIEEKRQKLNCKIHKALGSFDEAMTKVKGRWKIVQGKHGKINFNADAFEKIAMACCILHNICELRGDIIDPSWTDDVHESLFLRRGRPAAVDRDKDKSMEDDTSNDGGGNGENTSRVEKYNFSPADIKMALVSMIT